MIRTPDLLVRSQTLYPAELPALVVADFAMLHQTLKCLISARSVAPPFQNRNNSVVCDFELDVRYVYDTSIHIRIMQVENVILVPRVQ